MPMIVGDARRRGRIGARPGARVFAQAIRADRARRHVAAAPGGDGVAHQVRAAGGRAHLAAAMPRAPRPAADR